MYIPKIKTIQMIISTFLLLACASEQALEIDQSNPNYYGDETDNAELEGLTKEPKPDQQTESDDFKDIFYSAFSKCKDQGEFFDFNSGVCSKAKSVHTCSYDSLISGDYSDLLDKVKFEETVNDDSLIQCFDHEQEKIIQVAKVRNDGSGNLDIEISCWITAEEPCNI